MNFLNIVNLKDSSRGLMFSLYFNALTNFCFQLCVYFVICWNLPSVVAPNADKAVVTALNCDI